MLTWVLNMPLLLPVPLLQKELSSTKIGENTTNIFKLLFFTVNLLFVTSVQISTYRKLNLSLTSSTHFVFLPLGMQQRLEQTKYTTGFLTLFEKKQLTNL